MKPIYKPCLQCNGKGTVPVTTDFETTVIRRGSILWHTSCPSCMGFGVGDEVIGYLFNEYENYNINILYPWEI